MIRAHLWRYGVPRQPAQRTESTPRRLPSGAASHLDPSHRSSRLPSTGSFLRQAPRESEAPMPKYLIAYRKTDDTGQKPEWAVFTISSELSVEAHAVKERVVKRM